MHVVDGLLEAWEGVLNNNTWNLDADSCSVATTALQCV